MAVVQENAQPKHWFNEHRNPAINLGLFAFPAYILPILVATIFIWSQPHRRFLQRLNRNPLAPSRALRSRVRNDQAGDFPRQIQTLLAVFHVFCTGRALSSTTQFYKDDLLGYGSAEALSLLVAGFYLDPAMLPSYLATSTGWILLAIDKRLFAAAGLLSLPCAWQVLGQTGLSHWQSGILLLLIALEYAELDLGSDLVTYCTEHWIMAIQFPCFIIGGLMYLFRAAATQGNAQEATKVILKGIYDFCEESLGWVPRVCASFAPIAINVAATSFLAACIGWRWILLEETANSPFASRSTWGIWLFFYLMVWCLIQLLTERNDHQEDEKVMETFLREMTIDADVTGLTTTLTVILWWTILVIPHLHITI